MFGTYDIPFAIEKDVLKLSVTPSDCGNLYRRESSTGTVEKIILADNGKILLSPVEPLNKPKILTPNMLVKFERPVLVAPRSKKHIFLTFPLEIGVFAYGGRAFQIIDVINLARRKFTLYGDPRKGVICKYWESKIHRTLPRTDRLREGVLYLEISNATDTWEEAEQVVFNAFGMKLYYDDAMISMYGYMKVFGDALAETGVYPTPLRKGMEKSRELYTQKKLPGIAEKFVMEWGL